MNRNLRRFLSELCVMTLLLSVLPTGAVAGAEEAAALMNEGGAKAGSFTAAKAVEIEDYDTPLAFADSIDEDAAPAEEPTTEAPAEAPAEVPAEEPASEPAVAEEPAETPAEPIPAEEPAEVPAEEPATEPTSAEEPSEPAAEAPTEVPATEPAATEEPAEPTAEPTPAPAEAAEEPAPEAEQEAEEPFDVEASYHYYMSLGSDAEKDDFLLSLSEANRETLKRYIARMAAAAAAEAAARAALAAAQEAAPAEPAPEETAEEPTPVDAEALSVTTEEPAPEPDADTSAQQSVTIWYECLDGGEVGFGSQVCFHMNLEGVDPAEADYQWQISRDGGANWENVDYATDSTYIITVSEDNAACLWRVLVNF